MWTRAHKSSAAPHDIAFLAAQAAPFLLLPIKMRLSVVSVLALLGSGFSKPLNQTNPTTAKGDLQGTLMQLNATHVQVNITNTNKQAVALLRRHTLLHPGAEHFSLSVRAAGNHSEQEHPDHGEGALRFIYSRQLQHDSFVRIPAGSSWKHQFDITKLFKIPKVGAYDVSLHATFHGIYATGNGTNSSVSHGLQPIHMRSKPVTCTLNASAPTKQRRDNTDALAGCANERDQLLANIKAAAQMASTASDSLNNAALYKTYFGLVQGTTDDETFYGATYDIVGTYGKIAAYDPTKDTHITWNCASTKTLSSCTGSVLGYYQFATKSINLCSSYSTISRSLACTQPGPDVPALDEQEGVVLHELFHDRTGFATQNIVDFPDPFNAGQGCYAYRCATKFASDRDPNVLPERSAINYEQFAQAARYAAAPSGACLSASGESGTTPPPPPTELDADHYGPIGV